MQCQTIEIEIYDKEQKASTILCVQEVSDNIFRAIQNNIINYELTFGTEFETRINKDGKHEVVRIIKESDYITTSFFLTPKFTESEYRTLGDEIIRHGGYWQVDLGYIATVNLPANCELDLHNIFKTLGFNPTYLND